MPSKAAASARPRAAAKAATAIAPRYGKVEIAAPSASQVENNIRAGQEALQRARGVFLKPGVKLAPEMKVIYYVDPTDAARLIRETNGKAVSGRMVGERFVPYRAKPKAPA